MAYALLLLMPPFLEVPVRTGRQSQRRKSAVLARNTINSIKKQLCTILHSRWIFPRDNEWIFSPTGPLLDLGSNSGQCLRA